MFNFSVFILLFLFSSKFFFKLQKLKFIFLNEKNVINTHVKKIYKIERMNFSKFPGKIKNSDITQTNDNTHKTELQFKICSNFSFSN